MTLVKSGKREPFPACAKPQALPVSPGGSQQPLAAAVGWGLATAVPARPAAGTAAQRTTVRWLSADHVAVDRPV